MRRIERHHVILGVAFLAWLGYMLCYAADSFASTFSLFFCF